MHPKEAGAARRYGASFDGDPLRDPPGRGDFAARFQGPLGDQGEDDPLDGVAVQPATFGDPADRRPDPEAFPEAVQRPGPTIRRESRTSTSTPWATATARSGLRNREIEDTNREASRRLSGRACAPTVSY